MNRDQHIEKFFKMFPHADPIHHPLQFQHYVKLYKWLRSLDNEST